MQLGALANSLAVKNIHESKQFYAKLGFVEVGGYIDQNWLILRNGEHTLGLFQGMFDSNILTFNPGWDENATALTSFDDVRKIQAHLKSNNLRLDQEADIKTSGPASIMLTDPDGNQILIDQHL